LPTRAHHHRNHDPNLQNTLDTTTDDAVISVHGSLDGTTWTATPLMVPVLDKDVDFLVTGVCQFRVGVKRSGSTNTLISADLAFRTTA
jgi:hypothetical protein